MPGSIRKPYRPPTKWRSERCATRTVREPAFTGVDHLVESLAHAIHGLPEIEPAAEFYDLHIGLTANIEFHLDSSLCRSEITGFTLLLGHGALAPVRFPESSSNQASVPRLRERARAPCRVIDDDHDIFSGRRADRPVE